MLGLIDLIPNRGAFVSGISQRDVNDFFYMKSLLYPQCVKWAVERITEEEFAMLEEAFTFMQFYAVRPRKNPTGHPWLQRHNIQRKSQQGT